MLSIFAGLFAGALHVVGGPDHLAAVAPLSADRGAGAARLGFRWGVGHSGGVILVGLITLFVRDFFDVAAFSSGAEWLVGATLIGIGLWGLRQSYSSQVRAAAHDHGPVQR